MELWVDIELLKLIINWFDLGDGTSDISSGVSMQLRHIDFKYLYAEGKNEENRSQRKVNKMNCLWQSRRQLSIIEAIKLSILF